jgi:RNA polymerase sigma factor (sigma-70 family)
MRRRFASDGNKARSAAVSSALDDKRTRFEAQVLPHLDAAHRLARWLTRSPGEADDVVQEAFLKAFRAFESLRNPDARAWMLAIVRNCALDALAARRRRAHEPLDESGAGPGASATAADVADPERASIEHDERRTLERLLAELPAEHREVLLLREIEELSYREIAAVTRLPIGTVMSRLARARAALRSNWLGESEGEPRAVR